jgi:hypothetical protein
MLSLLSIVLLSAKHDDRAARRCASIISMEKVGLVVSNFIRETREIKLLTPEEKLKVLVNT